MAQVLKLNTSISNTIADTQTSGNSSENSSTIFNFASNMFSTGKKMEEAKPTWGFMVKKDPFMDMEMLENGFAREYMSDECLSPTPNDRKWTNCYVERVNKTQYRMYEDLTGRFLLSAKQEGDVFYISQYESFPDQEGSPANNYCAILKKTENSPNFKLYNCGCEGCDKDDMKFSCSCPFSEEGDEGADRQLLADISQSTKRIKHVDADMRSLSVILPAVNDDRKSRVVWCPRSCGSSTPRGTTPRGVTPRTRIRNPSFSASSPSPSPSSGVTSEMLEDDRLELASKLPEWNPDLKSLVLKFHGGRVLAASSKNFLLTTKQDTSRGVLQFGKSRRGKFVLDYRFPFAPIQAFGVCLSACCWSAE